MFKSLKFHLLHLQGRETVTEQTAEYLHRACKYNNNGYFSHIFPAYSLL